MELFVFSRILLYSLGLIRILSDFFEFPMELKKISRNLLNSVGFSPTLPDFLRCFRIHQDYFGFSRMFASSFEFLPIRTVSIGISRILSDSFQLFRFLSDLLGVCRMLSPSFVFIRIFERIQKNLWESYESCRILLNFSRILDEICKNL